MKYIGEIIMVIIGIYITLIGFRVISVSKTKGQGYEEWYKKWGSKLKIIGPLIIIIFILMMFLK